MEGAQKSEKGKQGKEVKTTIRIIIILISLAWLEFARSSELQSISILIVRAALIKIFKRKTYI